MNVAAQMAAPAGVPFVPEHELFRPISSGAYGQVWLARNALGVYRAVKIVRRASFDHDRPFEREFAGIKAFEPVSRSHEGLVNLLQVGRDDAAGYFYYVMELADDARQTDGVLESWSEGEIRATEPYDHTPQHSTTPPLHHSLRPGLADPMAYLPRTLASELKRRGRLPLEECIRIGLSLTKALAHLQLEKLVHRDIKPSNIIFVRGVPKLADVGLVTGVSEARSFVGTEGFIPPEGPGTAQADIYSLGIVLYVMSTGKSHEDFPEPLSDPGALPSRAQCLEFDAVIHKACQANVRERYQTAEEMLADLALLQRGGSVKQKRAAKRRWAVATRLGFATIAVLLLITPLLWWRGIKPGHQPNPEAMRLYQLGRWYYGKLTPGDHQKAFGYLNQAVQIDPRFVQPYRELTALCVWGEPGLFATPEAGLRQVKEIADTLMALNPKSAEGHTALSWYKFQQQDLAGAEDEIVRAIKLDPNYAIAHDIYGFYLSILGRPEEAIREGQRSQELDPTARVSALVAAWPFFAARQFDRAIAQAKRILELDQNFPEAHNFLGRCYEAQSNYVAAIEEFEKFDLLVGHDPARVKASYAALRQAYDTMGEEGYLRKYIELIRENEALPAAEQVFFVWDLPGYYARLGENDKAFEEIEKHFDIPGLRNQLKFEPFYDTLHDDPRYKALVRRAGLER